jgi:hypothetical protein
MDREARSWRRLAIGGAAATALLTIRLFLSPQTPLYRWLHPEHWGRFRAETWPQEIERRLAAVEEHLRHLPPERTM